MPLVTDHGNGLITRRGRSAAHRDTIEPCCRDTVADGGSKPASCRRIGANRCVLIQSQIGYRVSIGIKRLRPRLPGNSAAADRCALAVMRGATACLILRRDRCCKTGNDRAERCAGTQSSKATLLSRPHHHTGFAQHLHDPPPIATAEVRSGAAIAANKGRVARALSVHPFVELAERKTLAFDAALGEVVRIKRTLDV